MVSGVALAKRSPRTPLKAFGAAACLAPWLLATLFEESPALSWWISWLGSWLIIFLVFTGRVFTLPSDRPQLDQVLRPWFLMHLVFAAYNFLTAIFYWLDLNGITLGLADPVAQTSLGIELASKAQRNYVLAHAGLVIGLGLVRQLPRTYGSLRLNSASVSLPLLLVAGGAAALALLFQFLPGLSQLEVKMTGVFTVAAAVGLGVAYHEKSPLIVVAIALNVALFLLSMTSGWKSASIVMVILVASAFYPVAPKRTVALTALVFVIGVGVLPSISSHIRERTWQGQVSRWEAFGGAISDLQSKSRDEVRQDAWQFLSERVTEMGLFVKYLDRVPDVTPYFGFSIVVQAIEGILPRIVWPEKPDLEEQVRERVTMLGVIEQDVEVSAKPQYVADGYISAGETGVFISLVILGIVAQLMSNLCVSRFGGYVLGGVAFNGLFGIMWQGSAFEFVANAVFWSFVATLVLSWIGSTVGVLRR